MQDIEKLKSRSLKSLLDDAWKVRQNNFSPILTISAPSPKIYITDHFRNQRNKFVNISLTGTKCELNCEHCKRKLLDSMISATNPDRLMELGDDLVKRDCDGVLLSGGAERSGGVQFSGFYNAIKYLKQKGLKVIVHTGLIDEETAVKLKESAVDQVLIDVIGDEDTINQVYHLDKSPEDFEKSLEYMKNTGLNIAPHIVIGLNYGKISGEYKAIEMISKVEPDVIVLVILSPMRQTPMFGVLLPSPEDIAKIAAVARIYNPNTPITLGCVRPSGSEKVRTERLLIRAGVNGITYPMDQTIEFSESLGLKSEFKQTCCSLLTI